MLPLHIMGAFRSHSVVELGKSKRCGHGWQRRADSEKEVCEKNSLLAMDIDNSFLKIIYRRTNPPF